MGQLPLNTLIRSVYENMMYGNGNDNNSNIGNDNSGNNNKVNDGIFKRPIVPKMFIGTNGQISSAMAYLNPGPSTTTSESSTSTSTSARFTEIITSSYDGAEIYLDWEIPLVEGDNNNNNNLTNAKRKNDILCKAKKKIKQPIVLILHGINNSSKYGYMKSLSRTFVKQRGWNSVSMNFRGIHPDQNMTTPRSYNAAYTGDIRSVVNQLSSRLVATNHHHHHQDDDNPDPDPVVPPYLFLVGNSLGANIITKYLGEEGLADTLPYNVKGGISLGNPFTFHSNKIKFPFNEIMGIARKINYYKQRKSMKYMIPSSSSVATSSRSVTTDIRNISLSSLDRIIAPYMIRNSVHPPYETKIGYGYYHDNNNNAAKANAKAEANYSNNLEADAEADAEAAAIEYWNDSSSYKQQRHITIPFMHIIAKDDYLCYNTSQQLLNYTLSNNPNIIFVTTQCGGHLGWQSEISDSSESEIFESHSSWFGNSWADNATSDFFQAIIDINTNTNANANTNTNTNTNTNNNNNNAKDKDKEESEKGKRVQYTTEDNEQLQSTRGEGEKSHVIFVDDDDAKEEEEEISSVECLAGDCTRSSKSDSSISTSSTTTTNNCNNNDTIYSFSSNSNARRDNSSSSSSFTITVKGILLKKKEEEDIAANTIRLERNRRIEKEEAIDYSRRFRPRL